jgi:hypothetical protein
VGTIVAFPIFTIVDMVWPMDNKFEAGRVMDGLHDSSFSHSDQDKKKGQPQNAGIISRNALIGSGI